MGCHIVIYGFHNRDDNMTLSKEIGELRQKLWRDAESSQMVEEIDQVINHVGGIDARIDVIERDLDNVRVATCTTDERVDKIESDIVNLFLRVASLEFGNPAGEPPEPAPEPFPGYNKLVERAIPIIEATIDQKERELTRRVV